jgi:hypothetical protein
MTIKRTTSSNLKSNKDGIVSFIIAAGECTSQVYTVYFYNLVFLGTSAKFHKQYTHISIKHA